MDETLDLTLAQWMTRGGDGRIVLDPVTGLNRYHSAPYPRDVLALASSTANDLGLEAFAYLSERFPNDEADRLESGRAYAELLEELRDDIRAAYQLDAATDIFFAPSGTDLEYVGLLAVAGRRREGIANLLLGTDEVGSGCIHSAAGRYFARQTALGIAVEPGQSIAGLPSVTIGDLPVRCPDGAAHDSGSIAAAMQRAISEALGRRRFPLVHIVHGSKTGLLLPHLGHVDMLRRRFGDDVAFVVDACQARITSAAIHDYLSRGIVVFLTGSKFMGGPPFSGFALLPPGLAAAAAPLAVGMARVFHRAEVPHAWAGRALCEATGNAGLGLRLAAALFELRRFQRIPPRRVSGIISAFAAAIDRLARDLKVRKVASAPEGDASEPEARPIEMRTLVTLDLCHAPDGSPLRNLDFDDAVRIHRALVGLNIRLGQPVRCVRLADGRWGATLRVGISMPQVALLETFDARAQGVWLEDAVDRIATALRPLLERN